MLMAQVDNPEIREGNKDAGVLQAHVNTSVIYL